MKTLNNYLKAYRKQSGLSQKDISYLIDKPSLSTVSKYEHGSATPTLETALSLHILYQVPIHKLFPKLYKTCEYKILQRLDCLSVTYTKSTERKDKAKVSFFESIITKIAQRNTA